jgi:inward rectifier potassium channel
MRLPKRFFTYSSRSQRVHIKIQDGRFQILGQGAWYTYWRDPYHLMLTVPWTGFLAVITILYLATNALFALLYSFGGDCIANAAPGSYLDKFFFSVQTLATIGYGAMFPKTAYANVIVTIEALVGIIGVAVLTGLAFARFSRPTARVLFSRFAVIAPDEGLPALKFRAANRRRNQILEAQMKAYLMRDEVNADGDFIRRIHDLQLRRDRTPSFALTWLAIHPIDEFSPLYGMTPEMLVQTNSAIAINLSGIDETVAQTVSARYMYSAPDILWNSRFVDVIYHTVDGDRYIDYSYFHEVEPLD